MLFEWVRLLVGRPAQKINEVCSSPDDHKLSSACKADFARAFSIQAGRRSADLIFDVLWFVLFVVVPFLCR